MGRHKSSLRELGWSAHNSPNPWKQGSAKRVVRTLDYSNVECDAKERSAAEPVTQTDRAWEDRLQQLQLDGRQQLDRIREQFEEQDAENRRKLDRLNGRIAELGENKHAMWSILRQHQPQQRPKGEAEATSKATTGEGPSGEASAEAPKPQPSDAVAQLRAREASLRDAEAALAQEARARNDALDAREAALAHKEDALEKASAELAAREATVREATHAAESAAAGARAAAEANAGREATLREGEAALAATREEISRREALLKQREDGLVAREESAALAASGIEARERAAATAEASLQQRQQQLAEAAAAAAAPLCMPLGTSDGCKEALAGGACASEAAAAPFAQGGSAHPVASKPHEFKPQESKMEQPVSKMEQPVEAPTTADASFDAREAPAGSDPNMAPSTSRAGVAEVKQELQRSKVRFDEMRQQLMHSSSAPPKPAQGAAPVSSSAPKPPPKAVPKPSAAKPGAIETEPKQLQCDRTADWARSENLTLSLLKQKADPDEVFFPLPHQRTCELTDIFSDPRRVERGKGSGEWTPASDTKPAKRADANEAKAIDAEGVAAFELVGMEGEYSGEVLAVPLSLAAEGRSTAVLGRSSSCDVTLGRDDQISRKHLQMDVREGKLLVRDLGSTYGTRLNGKALTAAAALVQPGDMLSIGASCFKLRVAASR